MATIQQSAAHILSVYEETVKPLPNNQVAINSFIRLAIPILQGFNLRNTEKNALNFVAIETDLTASQKPICANNITRGSCCGNSTATIVDKNCAKQEVIEAAKNRISGYANTILKVAKERSSPDYKVSSISF